MSRPRPTNGPPIQLFPFLDVFICTMGCLIVMLVVVSQKVREKTVAKVVAEHAAVAELLEDEPLIPEPITSTPEPELVVVSPKLDDTVTAAARATELAAAQQRILELEQRAVVLDRTVRERKASIAELNNEAQTTASKAAKVESVQSQLKERLLAAERAQVVDQAELRKLREEQQRLRDKIHESRKLLAEHKQNDGNSPYVIVPYDGVTGTTRRPIVLECTDDGIKFVSENIKLSANDLRNFTPSSNPVLAGCRELVRYWSSRNAVQDNPAAQPKPYVLLIVRPSGTLGYYVARGFLEELGTEFGYELVDEEFRFEAPPTEARATELCKAAIDEALKQSTSGVRPTESFSQALDAELKARALSGDASAQRSSSSGGQTFSAITDSGRKPEKFSSQSLSRGGGTASQKFFSSSNFSEHRAQVESPNSFASGTSSGSIASGSRPGSLEISPSGSAAQGGTTPQALAARERAFRDAASRKNFEFSEDDTPLIDEPAGSMRSDSKPKTGVASRESQDTGIEALNPGSGSGTGKSDLKTDSNKAPSSGSPAGTSSAANEGANGSSRRGSPLTPDKPAASGGNVDLNYTPLANRDIKDLTNFKRQWGVPNPKGTIALEKDMTLFLNSDRVIVNNRYRISRTSDRTNAEVLQLTLDAMDVVARDWGAPPEQFYWVPSVDLVVQRGGDIWKEPFKRSLEQAGVTVRVSYE